MTSLHGRVSAARSSRRAAALEALSLSGLGGAHMVDLAMLGTRAHVAVDVDLNELDRRVRAGVPALTDRILLRHLVTLPFGEPVRQQDLSPAALSVLGSAPDGTVELTRQHVVRIIRPVITLRGAATAGGRWNTGLNAVSPYAAFCPRVFALTATVPDLEHAALEAALYGIGLVQAQPGQDAQLRVPPAPKVATFGPASWRVRELALAESGMLPATAKTSVVQ